MATAESNDINYGKNLEMIREHLRDQGGLQGLYNSLRQPTQEEVNERLAWFSGVFQACFPPVERELDLTMDEVQAHGLTPEQHNERAIRTVHEQGGYTRDVAEDVVVAAGLYRKFFPDTPIDWREIDVTQARQREI